MLTDFYIPRLSNDMKIAVQKNQLEDQILYRSLAPSKKRRLCYSTKICHSRLKEIVKLDGEQSMRGDPKLQNYGKIT